MPDISSKLAALNIISGDGISAIFNRLFGDVLEMDYELPSKAMREWWSRYDNTTPSLNGSVFEALLAIIFYREGITPLYVQSKLTFVPNVDFDFVAYTREVGPVVLSAKTSLRERYKQADLEGMMLRQVHRRAKSYLITLNDKEAASNNKKIDSGQILGLDAIVLATDQTFDELIIEMKTYTFFKPEKVSIIESNRVID